MRIDTKQISILGSMWTIRSATKEEEPRFEKTGGDGFCDSSTRNIVILDIPDDECTIADIPAYARQCIRHEIIHAFFHESGLWVNSNNTDAWAMNEEMVDWIALQHEKLHDAFRQAGALDDTIADLSVPIVVDGKEFSDLVAKLINNDERFVSKAVRGGSNV